MLCAVIAWENAGSNAGSNADSMAKWGKIMAGGLLEYSGLVTKTKAMRARLLEADDYAVISEYESVTDFIAFLVVELPFGSYLFVEYIEVFHLGKIAFDGLHGLCLLCQAVFKLGLLHHLFHALCMDGGDRQEEKR